MVLSKWLDAWFSIEELIRNIKLILNWNNFIIILLYFVIIKWISIKYL